MGTKQKSNAMGCLPRKAVRDYLDAFKAHPSKKCRKHLDKIARRLDEDEIVTANCAHYAHKLFDIELGTFSRLTGYGQCEGRLIGWKNEIVICCCRDMASALALRDMVYFDGKMLISGNTGNPSVCDGIVYKISNDNTEVTNGCPFCGAPLEELTNGPAEGADL